MGVGSKIWFLIRVQPKPSILFSDSPALVGRLVFYLDGGHYTDLGSRELASRDAVIANLARWLESNEFPAKPKAQ